MVPKKLTAALIVASATAFAGLSGSALAHEGTQDDFMLFFSIKIMDKAYDMKAKAIGAKGGMIHRGAGEGVPQVAVHRRLNCGARRCHGGRRGV